MMMLVRPLGSSSSTRRWILIAVMMAMMATSASAAAFLSVTATQHHGVERHQLLSCHPSLKKIQSQPQASSSCVLLFQSTTLRRRAASFLLSKKGNEDPGDDDVGDNNSSGSSGSSSSSSSSSTGSSSGNGASSSSSSFNPFNYNAATGLNQNSNPKNVVSLRKIQMQQVTSELLDAVNDDPARMQDILKSYQDFLLEPLEDADSTLEEDSIYKDCLCRTERYQAYDQTMSERIEKARDPNAKHVLTVLKEFVLSFQFQSLR